MEDINANPCGQIQKISAVSKYFAAEARLATRVHPDSW